MADGNYASVKAWRKRNPEKVNAQAQRRYKRSPEMFAAASKRHRLKGGDILRAKEAERARNKRRDDPEGNRIRRKRFRAKREAKQVEIAGRPKPGLCELCGGNHHLGIVFDHCHATGDFRGWICDRCNKVLGLVKDEASLLIKMAAYLEKNGGGANGKTQECTTDEYLRGAGS